MPELSRRDFLKLSGASAGGVLLAGDLASGVAFAQGPKKYELKKRIGETTSICCYDGSGCGFIIASDGKNIVNFEGDPDHPINRGAACSKGAAQGQLRTVDGKLNPRRLTKVLYRAPGGTTWQEKSWDWALDEIAQRIKKTRDANWIATDADGYVVNRTEAIASLGGSALDNEECYALVKMDRALGMAFIEHHARL